MAGKLNKPKILEAVLVILVTLFFLFVLAGFLLPARVTEEGAWPLTCPPDTVFSRLQDPRYLASALPLLNDPARYHKVPYGSYGSSGGVAWYRKPDGHLKAYAEVLKVQRDSGLFISLNFREEGKASLWLMPRVNGNSTELIWRYEADFGFNPVARYFGLELRRMVTRDMKPTPPGLYEVLCQEQE